ncbi:MAG: HTTM domain-containing protein [Anaerolineales bacterium]
MMGIKRLSQPVSILPLVAFRISFGLLMLFSTVRFVAKGWVQELYLAPEFHFPYWGFEWVKPLPGIGLYMVFALMGLAAFLIAVGLFYRASVIAFFLLFTYIELLDKTYYLNHYYFVSLVSFLLIWVPAERYFSLDVWRKAVSPTREVPRWAIGIFQLQLGIVYFFAGVAKLNADWLFHAQPLRIWLAARAGYPVVGPLFDGEWFAFLMSWGGALFDLTIPFGLAWRRTRPWAYLAVIGFHVFTGWLFPIGVFPWVMIGSTWIFFDEVDYRAALSKIPLGKYFSGDWRLEINQSPIANLQSPKRSLAFLLTLFFTLQLLLPFRHFLYPGDVLWNEAGTRFAWRVMVAEKTGTATFFITDPNTGKTQTVYPGDYLTPQQEKQMAFQPDMLLAFAHFLRDEISVRGQHPVEIRAEVWVSLNGRGSQLLVDPTVNLANIKPGWRRQAWVSAFPSEFAQTSVP